ncbi:hypothetical protein KY333_02490, partial [Candidatus Woesearchaeota archaeon]|nr:hypothetical protein [Candidatus Woesearchaeota archaeon]
MKNKLMILLIIVLLTSFATAFEMDLGGLQDNNTRSQTQQAMAPQQTAQEQSSSRMDFTDMLADDTSESIIEITSQLEDTLPEPITEPVIDTGIDEFGLAGKLSDSNFETEIAEMLQDTKTPKATSEQEDDLFNNLAGRLKDPDKKVPGKVVGILKSDNTEAEHNTKILQRSKGKIDLKINFTRTDDNNTLLEKHAGAIREIVIKGHDERSPKNMLKIEQNLPRNITPFKSRGSFAIDPTQMNFTEMTLTFKASGSALYKCKAWNFTTKTCAPVQRDCTGEGKNQTCIVTGGWTKIMSLVPGRTYTLNITPEDPAFAQYNSTLGAPECADGESPCTATSALLQSRDNIGGTVEPNQPNTIDACTDGASGTYLTDESVENITVESLNGSYFRQGDTIRVNATFLCWNTANDNLNWVYTNTTTAPGWSVKAFTDPCPVARPNFYQGSHTWTLDNNAGKHAVRIINQYNGNTATTCGGGAYDDNDDVAFRVYTRVPPNVTNLTPVANTTYDVNDNVTVSARVEDDETRIRYVKANITLPDGTSVLVNLSRKVIGEVLENRTINGSWRTLNFTNTYDDPVVFASPLPLRDLRPAEVRIVNVTSTGFTVRAQEPTGDFPEADNHSNEWPISILVFETGVHKLSDGSYIEVHKNLSTTTVSGTGPDAWTTYSYNINFSAIPGTPVLLAQVQ